VTRSVLHLQVMTLPLHAARTRQQGGAQDILMNQIELASFASFSCTLFPTQCADVRCGMP